jgi:hypothetical protein
MTLRADKVSRHRRQENHPGIGRIAPWTVVTGGHRHAACDAPVFRRDDRSFTCVASVGRRAPDWVKRSPKLAISRRSTAGANGFTSTTSAPAARTRSSTSGRPSAVTTMIAALRVAAFARSASHSPTPSMNGSRTSVTISDGCRTSASVNASRPSQTSTTSHPLVRRSSL